MQLVGPRYHNGRRSQEEVECHRNVKDSMELANGPRQPKNEASGCVRTCDLHWVKVLYGQKTGINRPALRWVADRKGLRSAMGESQPQDGGSPSWERWTWNTIPHSLVVSSLFCRM
jgi:hypothetical protein